MDTNLFFFFTYVRFWESQHDRSLLHGELGSFLHCPWCWIGQLHRLACNTSGINMPVSLVTKDGREFYFEYWILKMEPTSSIQLLWTSTPDLWTGCWTVSCMYAAYIRMNVCMHDSEVCTNCWTISCMYEYIYVGVYVCTLCMQLQCFVSCVYTHAYTCIHAQLHTCIHARLYVCMYVLVCVCVYICYFMGLQTLVLRVFCVGPSGQIVPLHLTSFFVGPTRSR